MIWTIISKYCYLGYDYDMFQMNKDRIRRDNLASLFYVSIMGMFVSALLWLACHRIEIMYPCKYAFTSLFCSCMLTGCLADYAKEHEKISARGLIYLLYLMVFANCTYMGIFVYSNQYSTAISVFLVALPLFFVDSPVRTNLIQICAVAIFLILSKKCKADLFFQMDALTSISFLLIGMALYYHTVRAKFHEMESQEQIKKERFIDPLTQLLNRGGIEKFINNYVEDGSNSGAMILLDIDNFKSINDVFGHKAGDEMLCETAGLMKAQFGEDDIYGRLGGDEFVIFLPKIKSFALLSKNLEELVEKMQRTLIGDMGAYQISASVGIALFPSDGKDYDELYRNADAAMYHSKKNGKSGFTFYKTLDSSLTME